MSDLLSGLNQRQRDAAEALDGPILILAGAGSGKTRTLTYRAACLIGEHGLQPEDILVITFTNRAAKELRERLEGLLGEEQSKKVWAMTFHALCVRMLRRSGPLIGIPSDFTILDSADSRRMIARAAQDLGDPSYNNKDELAKIRAIISRGKNAGSSPDLLSGPLGVRAARVWERYIADCRESNSLDFDDLLLQGVKLLQDTKGGEIWGERFHYVMVDEYQDVNHIQEQLLHGLCDRTQNIFAIGDDSQSVYGWRGAEVEHILRFEHNWSDVQVHKLEENYRSTPSILRAAQAVIDRSHHRSDKKLVPTLPEGAPVRLLRFDNHWDEASFVADRVKQLRTSGVAEEDIAIAYRTNAQSQALEEALNERRIAYHVVGGVGFSKRVEVQGARAYMALLSNHRDRNALERLVGFPKRGIGPAALEFVFAQGNSDLIDSIGEIILDPPSGLNRKAVAGFEELYGLFEKAQNMKHTATLGELLHWMLNASGIVSYLRTQKERGRDQLENLDGLQELAERYQGTAAETLQDWIADTALQETEEAEQGPSGIKLMTMHASKGLEFPYFFLVGLEEQLFLRGDIDSKGLDEERRILYVGMTRAEKELVLSFADTRRLWGRELRTQPLQFLFDLPSEVVRQRARSKSGPARPGKPSSRTGSSTGKQAAGSGRSENRERRSASLARGRSPAQPNKPSADLSVSGEQFRTGMRVNHAKFGEGVVVDCKNNNVKVRFGKQVKTLQVQYAKLQILN